MRQPQTSTKKATRQHTKHHNARLVLKTIYENGNVSRADLARATGLTRATVSNIVADYLENGIVAETGYGSSLGGKPPILLSMVPDARQLVCLDLGNEQFTGALVNLRGQFEQQLSLSVNGRTGEAALNLLYELVDQLLANVTNPVLGIALGSPGLIDTDTGLVKQSVNLDWHDLPLQQLLVDRYAFPVHIANDSHLAALAEYSYGKDTGNLVLIKMGKGIGSGIVLNGRIFSGEGFGAGEIGHIRVVDHGDLCTCGNVGCLETVASIRAMLKQAELVAAQNPNSLLSSLRPSADVPISWNILHQASQQGDADARQIITQAGEYLGRTVANLVGILNVNRIVIAGNVAQTGDLFINAVESSMLQRVLPKLAQDTSVQYATVEPNLVLLGASALILSRGLGVI
ncbi:MAG: sugar kinase [Ardenticatenaceae bacterium]|nr:MAG: sugar kinase [Ardenticatenaceae bacterium]